MAQNSSTLIIQSTIALSGDVSGNLNQATTIKLQGNSVNATAPLLYQVLMWDNADGYWRPWYPSSIATNTVLFWPYVSATYPTYTWNQNYSILFTAGSSGTNDQINIGGTAQIGTVLFLNKGNHIQGNYKVTSTVGGQINGGSPGGTAIFSNEVTLVCYDGTNWVEVSSN